MKKNLILASLVLLLFRNVMGSCPNPYEKCFDFPEGTNNFVWRQAHGRSFMYTRPLWQHLSTNQAIWHDQLYNKPGPMYSSVQITGAYQQSRPQCQTSEYFLLPNKPLCLTVAGDDTSLKDCRDIRAEWLNLPSDFNGEFCINPTQRQWGIFAEYNQNVTKFIDYSFFCNWWVSIQLPIMAVTNNINISQKTFNPGTPTANQPTTIIQAFNQPSWKFGKIDGQRSRVELGAIWLKAGSAYRSDHHQIAYYTGIIFPTSSKQNPEYLFDPITGLDGHVGLNAGVNFNILLNCDPSPYGIYLFLNLEDIFLIRNDQCRTFGLRDWKTCCPKFLSRFMQFNRLCPPTTNEPGVNVLTLWTRVKPFSMVDFSTGFRIKWYEQYELEVGFDIWGHTQEKLEIRHPWDFPLDVGIAGDAPGTSASTSTIAQQGPNDLVFTPITVNDLDLYSAASGSTLNYKAHGSFGGTYHGSFDSFFGIGWFLEFPQKNGALKTWGVWGKLGASF